MPRREYLKYFAHDAEGNYSGSEPWRAWSEEELEDKFKKYEHEKIGRWEVRREGTGELIQEDKRTER